LVALATFLAAAAGWNNSATTDEPANLFAAYEAVRGRGLWLPEHPPLYKLAAGIPLHFLPLAPPPDGVTEVAGNFPALLHVFLHRSGVEALTLLRTARLGVVIFLPLLLWGLYRLGELAAGPPAAWAAVVAAATQPLLLGHAFVVHGDVPAAACWTWAILWAERWLRNQPRAWVWLGLWVGLALAAKNSGVYLLLFLALRFLLAQWRGQSLPWRQLGAALTLALGVPWLLIAWTLRHVSVGEEQTLIALVAARFVGWESLRDGLISLAEVSCSAAHWLLGLAYVAWVNAHGQGVNFFFGQTSAGGFWLYFPVALLAKLSVPFFLLSLSGLFRLRWLSSLARWGLAYTGLFLLAALGSSYNIGARHLMPLLPLLALSVGEILLQLVPWLRQLALAGLVLSPLWAFPSYIGHFSLLVGGLPGGEKILNDSNLDWGQDWARLAQAARKNRWQPLAFVYLGTDDPESYGVAGPNLLFTPAGLPAGYVALSSFAAQVGPAWLEAKGLASQAQRLRELVSQLQGCQPVGRVGSSITVLLCGAKGPPEPGPAGPTPNPRE
jgi:hypothetical protein